MGKVTNAIKETEGEAWEIARRIRKGDYSGNTGIAIKNSTYSIARTLVTKFGSLLFIVILARLLAPEMYGLYGLALSTIYFLSVFSDLGISNALTAYLSKYIDKSKVKAKSYFVFISKIKIFLVVLGGLIIVLTAHYFSNTYYNKPIFYALLAGGIYYPVSILSRYLGILFMSKNNFKIDFIAEFIFQGVRLAFVPLLVLYLIPRVANVDILLLYIFLAISLCFVVTGLYYVYIYFKKGIFKGVKARKLNKKEKQEFFTFVLPLTLTSFSGVFFGYIDTIMLGHYVESQFIAYYQAAFHLVASASIIISFTGASLFPLFSRLSGTRLKRSFRKTRNITVLASLITIIVTLIVAPYAVYIVYGSAYAPATLLLRIFSVILISFPLISLYQTYYTSQQKTKEFSILLFISTVLNVLLNYTFINIGLTYGMYEALIGACLATIISRYTYLFTLAIYKRKIERNL